MDRGPARLSRAGPPSIALDAASVLDDRLLLALLLLPPERGAVLHDGRDLVERVRVVEPAVLHHARDRLGVADVGERVLVHDEQIRKLAGLERADLGVVAEVLRALERAAAQRLVRRPAAAHRAP